MNNKLDHLFRSKLEGHEVTPSPEAWQKLNGRLKEKRIKGYFIWSGIAAAVALLLISVWFINTNTPVNNIPAQQQIAVKAPENNLKVPGFNANINPSVTEQQQETPNTTNVQEKSFMNITDNNESQPPASVKTTSQPNVEQKSHYKKPESEDIAQQESEPLLAVNDTMEESKSVTPTSRQSSVKIVYNLEPAVKVDSSVLQQKNTPEQKEEKMFDKIAAFAKNVKSQDISLGQLRTVKDNILSFNGNRDSEQQKENE